MKKLVKGTLQIRNLSVPQKVEKARAIVTSMTGNTHFTNPVPSLADVTTSIDDLEKAYIESRAGSHTAIKAMQQKEATMYRLLTALMQHVEFIANQDSLLAETVISSAGIAVRSAPTARINEFRGENTELSGKVVLRTRSLNRAGYRWEYALADDQTSAWQEQSVTLQATVFIDGLNSAKRYKFRVATITKDGQGPWSNEVVLLVA